MSLTREQIKATDDRRLTGVECPEWGGSVYVRAMTLGERLELADLTRRDGNVTLELVILAACDADGTRLFAAGDLEWIAGRDGAVLQRIALAAIELNGLRQADTDAAEKN